MRITSPENRIFDTQVDTKKIFVPMKHSFKLRNRVDRSGKSPIYLHVSQSGKRERIMLEWTIDPKLWDHKKGLAIEKTQEGMDVNLILKSIEAKITEIKTIYRLGEIFLSLEKFMEEFSNGFPRTDFILYFEAQLAIDRPSFNKIGTYKNQRKVFNKLKKFRDSIPFREMNMELLRKFKNWSVLQGNASTTINNSIKVIKKYLIRANNSGIKFPLNTVEIICGPTTGNRVDLDATEINKLIQYLYSGFINEHHIIPLVKFLISCFTGLRISDVQQLKQSHIIDEKIKFTAIKTGKRQIIQMPITVKNLINDFPAALTSEITDQHINRILKPVAKFCGIKKVVTFHVARHSFATNYLRLGGTVEVLKEILGHSNIKETMIYVHIYQEELDREMMIMDNLIVKKESPILPLYANNGYWQSQSVPFQYQKTNES